MNGKGIFFIYFFIFLFFFFFFIFFFYFFFYFFFFSFFSSFSYVVNVQNQNEKGVILFVIEKKINQIYQGIQNNNVYFIIIKNVKIDKVNIKVVCVGSNF
ncbi:hypothetical protein [Plasmodium yoelii yoelii]|uniref:Uncharacterized protein n=1 Tax=Plasmodium yoelii yoelii TaxID=73239 RepID=Q7RNT6_PLAYO|nr:hypothetical protein [Plasmodium yoelii yoelii]